MAEVFARLADHSRTRPGSALLDWWPERRATAACRRIARPDAYGDWAEHGRRVPVVLELDRGTEPIPRVLGKLTGYRDVADATRVNRPVLFLLPTGVRERHLHDALPPALSQAEPDGGLVIATAADYLDTTGRTPADAVWLRPGTRRRVRLIDLGPPRNLGLPR